MQWIAIALALAIAVILTTSAYAAGNSPKQNSNENHNEQNNEKQNEQQCNENDNGNGQCENHEQQCDGNVKVTICHVPPGNPENAHTITISQCAVQAHLRNHPGDHIGQCQQQPPQQNITCEQAVQQGLLTGTINGGNATVTNNANQSFEVSLAVYKMFSANIFDQILFDSQTKQVPHGTTNFMVNLPMCAFQIELVCGQPIQPPFFNQSSIIASQFGNQNNFCTPMNTSSNQGISATLSIAPFFPQDGNFTFICTANGFTATNYTWYFGDGGFLPQIANNVVFHHYAPGSYTVACRADAPGEFAVAAIPISVS
jgi:uncharacterized low-complexity protein